MIRNPLPIFALLLATPIVLPGLPARADDVGSEAEAPPKAKPRPGTRQLEEPPLYGIYYDRHEPTFYTGFAPRTQEPERVHIQIGRGNQVRITSVLSDQAIRRYARDLLARHHTYRALIADGRIELTQNHGFARFDAKLQEIGLGEFVAAEAGLSAERIHERNLRLLEQLNPGRVFRIELQADELARRWAAQVSAADRKGMDRDRRLELVNLVLPTRLHVAELDAATRKQLAALVDATDAPDFDERFRAFFDRVTGGIYSRAGDDVAFVEFTAIYPIGSFNEYTDHHGRKIPLYPTPGRRALTTHQRTHTVDHIPTKVSYSYSPWIPYMHVGKTLHNSFHTLWWWMKPEDAVFLSEEWRDNERRSPDGQRKAMLWLLSRGPMSSGCTHVNTGHINEFRQLLPSETEKLYEIDVFLNRSYDYDVFDIDGDFQPEVMGVRYFIAYSLRNKQAHELRVRNERHAYYDWLYAGELHYDDEDRGYFEVAQDGRFVERTAKKGRLYHDVPLHEAAYEPENIQFYRLVDIDFARELRQVALEHPFGGGDPAVAYD